MPGHEQRTTINHRGNTYILHDNHCGFHIDWHYMLTLSSVGFCLSSVTWVSNPLLVCGCPRVVDRLNTSTITAFISINLEVHTEHVNSWSVRWHLFLVARFSPHPLTIVVPPLHRVVLCAVPFHTPHSYDASAPGVKNVYSCFISRTGIPQNPNSTDYSCVLA